jgi:hypothetical protein
VRERERERDDGGGDGDLAGLFGSPGRGPASLGALAGGVEGRLQSMLEAKFAQLAGGANDEDDL